MFILRIVLGKIRGLRNLDKAPVKYHTFYWVIEQMLTKMFLNYTYVNQLCPTFRAGALFDRFNSWPIHHVVLKCLAV